MELIYHGCFTKNADGTNKLIGPGEKCLTPTAQCFWKDPKDFRSGVKTRSQSANQPTVSTEDYEYYFQKKQRIEQWILGAAKYTTKASDWFFIV